MSTIRVNTLQSTSTTDGGISIDTSGNVTLPANTKVGTQNLPSAGPLSNRNLIINGAMQVAQRGASATNSGYGSVDRWRPGFNNVGITHSQQTLSSGDGTPYDEGFRKFYRQANTSVSSGTSTYIEVFTSIEAQDIAGSGWNYNSTSSYITLSFWVRSSLAGTYYSIIRSFDGSIKYYTKAFTLSADTWTKVTYSVPGHSDLAFDNDTGNGLRVAVIPYYGTDYTDNSVSTDTWFTLSGGNHMPDYLQNWANTASATFDLTGVQLEVGSVATPFEHRSYGDELARCQRYFEVGRPMGWIVSKYNSSQSYGLCHTFVVEKRATPSVTPPSSVIMAHGSGQGSFTNASVTTADITNRAYTNYINAGAYSTYFCYIASGEVFTFSAEL